jgi:hypothetical protein
VIYAVNVLYRRCSKVTNRASVSRVVVEPEYELREIRLSTMPLSKAA